MVSLTFDPVKTIQRPAPAYAAALKKYITKILLRFGRENHHCSVLFCDDAFIQNLNRSYRGKDYATDVLSFAQEEGEVLPSGKSCLGDVVVSAETALKQAQEFNVSYEEELARLCTHGVLHLLGYDHEKGEDAEKEMLALQDELLDSFMLGYAGMASSHI